MMTQSNLYCESGECKFCICSTCNVECSYCPMMQDIGTTVENCDSFKQRGSVTNGDKIRQMTDEELVKYIGLACKRCIYHTARISECADRDCMDGNLEWLKQEVSEDAGTD